MSTDEELLLAAASSMRGRAAADEMCRVCVQHTDVDAASVSLTVDDGRYGPLGFSGTDAADLDEISFTLGVGPARTVSATGRAVSVADLDGTGRADWWLYRSTMLEAGTKAVFAYPIDVGGHTIAVLELFRSHPGPLTVAHERTARHTARWLRVPVVDLVEMANWHQSSPGEPVPRDLEAMTRPAVSRATGMLVTQLGVGPVQALSRLRAYAYASGRSSTSIARGILDHTVRLDLDLDRGDGG